MAFQKLQTFDLQEKPLPSHFDKVENRLWVTTKFEPPPKHQIVAPLKTREFLKS